LSFDHDIHVVDQVLVRYRRHGGNRSDEVDFMLAGMLVHFGKILQDTPPRLRHMLPSAKRKFFVYLKNSFLAEGLDLDHVDPAQYHALEARCRELEERICHLADERDVILSSRSWRVTAPLRQLSLGARRMIGWRRRLQGGP
jgi:hypothetical protein